MTENRFNMGTQQAVFTSEDKPDTVARLLKGPLDVSFSIDMGDGEGPKIVGPFPKAQKLQLAESLQFLADTISADIPGRLTPFARGWINVATDLYHRDEACDIGLDRMLLKAIRHLSTAAEDNEDRQIDIALAIITLMQLDHITGMRVTQIIEDAANGKI